MKPYFIIVILVAILNVPFVSAQTNKMFKPTVFDNETEVETEKISDLAELFLFSDVMTPLLGETEKQDMYDYYKNNMDAIATNRLGGKSQLLELKDDYLKLQVSESHIVEVRSYLDNRKVEFVDTVIVPPFYVNVVLSTVKVPAADTEIAFYDVLKQKLDTEKFIQLPQIEDFFNVKSKKQKKELMRYIEFPLIQYEFTAEGELIAKTTIADYMSEEQFKEVEQYIIPKLVYKWNTDKTKFELLKN